VKLAITAQLALNLLEPVLAQQVISVQQGQQHRPHVQMDITKIMCNNLIAFSALQDISASALQEQ
jgi:hypothetical protein